MKPPRSRRLRRLRWFIAGLWAASLPFVGPGCAGSTRVPFVYRLPSELLQPHHLQGLHAVEPESGTIHRTGYQPGETKVLPSEVPAPSLLQGAHQPLAGVPTAALAPAEVGKPVPVSLDLVFRLAEEQNPRIAQARETVQESCLESELKAKEASLPLVTMGLGYYRHEGGIQNENGTLTNSSMGALFPNLQINSAIDLRQAAFTRLNSVRQQVQSRAELVKITNEVLLDAANTYVDLLAARRAEVVTRETERLLLELQARAEKQAEEEPLARLALEAIRSEVTATRQMQVHTHQQGNSAAAKLAYLLGLGTDCVVTPIDRDLVPVQLCDVNPPVEALVARVQESGPGVQELYELLAMIQHGLAESESLKQWLPAVQLSVAEGPFLAGPGASLDIRNRLDVLLGVRWNLTDYLTAKEKRRVARSKLVQLEHRTQELKNQLALAVRDGRETILAARERFRLAGEQIRSAAELYRLGREAVLENLPADKVKISDVAAALRTLREAHLAHIQTVQNHNKAQVRLLLLLGR